MPNMKALPLRIKKLWPMLIFFFKIRSKVMHCDLDLYPFDPKIYRCLPSPILYLCMKYEVCRLRHYWVIALQQSVDGQTDRRMDRVITIGLLHLRRGPHNTLLSSSIFLPLLTDIYTHKSDCGALSHWCHCTFIQTFIQTSGQQKFLYNYNASNQNLFIEN